MRKLFRPTIYVKGLILISIPLLFELTFGATMFGLQHYYREVIAQETKAKAVIYHANEMWLNTTDAIVEKIESNIFRNVQHSQHEEERNLENEYLALKELVKDEPDRLKLLNEVKRISDMLLVTGGQFERTDSSEGMDFSSKIAVLRGRFSSFQRIQTQLKRFGTAVRAFRAPDVLRSQDAEVRVAKLQSTIEMVIIGGVIFSVIMNALLLLYFMKGINRGLQALMENTKRMEHSKELLSPLTSDDEFGHLDRQFHHMAMAVESARRRERATINNAADMICVLDEQFRIVSVNPAGLRMLGCSLEHLKERGLQAVVLEEDFSPVRTTLADLLAGQGTGQFECRAAAADGNVIWTSWNVQWSADDREFFCVAHNVTERKRMEQMKQEFFGMISHDMRTPLSSIVASVGNLLAGAVGELPQKANNYLQMAERSAQYLLSLMQDLLDMERLAAGAFPLKLEKFDLSEVLNQAREMVEPLAKKAGLTVTVPEGSFLIEGDRDALTRVIVNLVSNAVKFSTSGSSIDLAVVQVAGGFRVEVTDHGRGIPEELQSKVFDRFKQVNIEDSKKQRGSGLGLAICKGFVEAHGGTIGVRSKIGEGSTFWFTLPEQVPVSA